MKQQVIQFSDQDAEGISSLIDQNQSYNSTKHFGFSFKDTQGFKPHIRKGDENQKGLTNFTDERKIHLEAKQSLQNILIESRKEAILNLKKKQKQI